MISQIMSKSKDCNIQTFGRIALSDKDKIVNTEMIQNLKHIETWNDTLKLAHFILSTMHLYKGQQKLKMQLTWIN